VDHFQYRNGALWCEQTPVTQIAEAAGTPAFVYSAGTLRDHYRRLADGFAPLRPIICYSIKSCANLHICRFLRELGAGFDVVSGGELARALEAGGEPSKIVFAGVGKTDDEIRAGIEAGIGWFNIESEAELENLAAISAKVGRPVRAALRVNPDVDPKTHRYTSTGKKETKFGVDLERARRVFESFGRDGPVRLTGIHLHIGSPVNDVSSYVSAVTKAIRLIDELRAAGFTVDMLDIGGGFGAHYRGDEAPDAQAYAKAIVPLVEPYVARGGLQVVIEPGRSISGNAGVLLSRVLYRKRGGEREFLIIDAGMTELIRPALYEAYHFMWPVAPTAGFVPEPRGESAKVDGLVLYDVVGPICESGDFLAKERRLPPMERGDLLAVFTAGAYGMVMASNYNSRGRPPEVLVEGDSWRVIRRRESYDDLVGLERPIAKG